MIFCRSDSFWNGASLGCEPALRPWLHDHGSLTQRIQQRCQQFAVHPVRSGLARIAFDEAALLAIAPHRLAYSREVFLYADGQPVVFAHSTCAQADLRGAWSSITGLGNRSLGSLLFTHPQVVRQPLHFKALRPHHPLYRSAITPPVGASLLAKAPEQFASKLAPTNTEISNEALASTNRLWARRSLFYLYGAPLLVTEVFLPQILRLGSRSVD